MFVCCVFICIPTVGRPWLSGCCKAERRDCQKRPKRSKKSPTNISRSPMNFWTLVCFAYGSIVNFTILPLVLNLIMLMRFSGCLLYFAYLGSGLYMWDFWTTRNEAWLQTETPDFTLQMDWGIVSDSPWNSTRNTNSPDMTEQISNGLLDCSDVFVFFQNGF